MEIDEVSTVRVGEGEGAGFYQFLLARCKKKQGNSKTTKLPLKNS